MASLHVTLYIDKYISQYEPKMKKKNPESASKASVEVKLKLTYISIPGTDFLYKTLIVQFMQVLRERSKKTYLCIVILDEEHYVVWKMGELLKCIIINMNIKIISSVNSQKQERGREYVGN